MSPISPLNPGAARPAEYVLPGSNAAGSCSPSGASAVAPQSVARLLANPSINGTEVATQVSQLLRSIGSDLENDKVLKTLLALLVLMALLADDRQSATQSANLLSGINEGLSRSQARDSSWSATFEYQRTVAWSVQFPWDSSQGSAAATTPVGTATTPAAAPHLPGNTPSINIIA